LAEKEIEVSWGLPDDEPEIGELLELNRMLHPLAFEALTSSIGRRG